VRDLQAQVATTEGLLSKERSANKDLAAAGDQLRQELGGAPPSAGWPGLSSAQR
jgi:hypothetical protein